MTQKQRDKLEQAAKQYAGSFEGPYRKDAYYAHLHGQEEEYPRTKWVKVDGSRPEGPFLLQRCKDLFAYVGKSSHFYYASERIKIFPEMGRKHNPPVR